MAMKTDILLTNLCFGEGPRWHDGSLWFSDMHDHKVLKVDATGDAEVIAEVPNRPSGLGWLPDGRLLVVSMADRRLLRLDGSVLVEHADLSQLTAANCNDMVVDPQGRAWVGNFGYDLFSNSPMKPAELIRVDPDGTCSVAADNLLFPNGTVITPDGATMIIGETMGARLTAFNLSVDGHLSNRRIWAQLDGAVPDGICLDAEFGVWIASPISHEVLRVVEGGQVTHRVPVDNQAYACMLGGDDRRTLYILTAVSSVPEECVLMRSGRLETVRVDIPGAGYP